VVEDEKDEKTFEDERDEKDEKDEKAFEDEEAYIEEAYVWPHREKPFGKPFEKL